MHFCSVLPASHPLETVATPSCHPDCRTNPHPYRSSFAHSGIGKAHAFKVEPVSPRLHEATMEVRTPLLIHGGEHRTIEPIGSCDAMLEIFRCIDRVASTGVNILIRGEAGSGRKLLGETIHRKSTLHERPFLIATAESIGELLDLWEQETGSIEGNSARYPRGTLFIDEIGTLSLASQRKLLRIVQENESRNKEGSGHYPFRIIASTALDLEQRVRDRAFREELFYRLTVVTLNLPPLRNRGADLLELAGYFLAKFSADHGRTIDSFSPEAIKLLTTHEWPGNVRELADTVERAVIATHSGVIQRSTLALELKPSVPESGGLFKLLVTEYEKRLITDALSRCRGKLNDAARLLKTSNRVVAYKVKKYAIDYLKYRHL